MGALTIITGDPGVGKSLLAIDIAARVTVAKGWPDGVPHSNVAGDVVYIGGEDDLRTTVRPRLEAAGADVTRVFALEGVCDVESHETRTFHLRRHHQTLREFIKGLPTPGMVLIDPLWAHLPSCGSAAEVGAAVADINRTAQEFGIAFIAVTHLNKQATARAIYRSAGNLALIGSTRCAHLVAVDERAAEVGADRRLFVPLKNNLSKPQPALAFSVGKNGIEWEPNRAVDETEDGTLQIALTPRQRLSAELKEARAFVTEMLGAGPALAADVFAGAAARGLSRSLLRRAAHQLEVEFRKDGTQGRWTWAMPRGEDAPISRKDEKLESSKVETTAVGETSMPPNSGRNDG